MAPTPPPPPRDLTSAAERVAAVLRDWEREGGTLTELAEHVGCTHATLSQWRHGKTNVANAKVGLMLRFAEATGVRLEWLLTGDGARAASALRYPPPELARLVTELQVMEASDPSAYRLTRGLIDAWASQQGPGDDEPPA